MTETKKTFTLELVSECLSWLDLYDTPLKSFTENEYCKLVDIPNKGYGLIAKKDIKPFTILFMDRPILHETINDKDEYHLLKQYNTLPTNKQEIVLNLCNSVTTNAKNINTIINGTLVCLFFIKLQG